MKTKIISRRTDAVLVEAHVNGRVKASVIIWDVQQPDPTQLLIDTADLASAEARGDLVRQIPEALRLESAQLLEDLATDVIQQRSQWQESAEESGAGHAVAFADPEPWPEAVDGAVLLASLAACFRRHIVLPAASVVAIVLWILHSHAHNASDVSPLLALHSPEKRCGKSTTLALLGALAPRPLSVANISPAALFRAVERYAPTLLVDEADTFLTARDGENASELRGILNSGHHRAGAYVVRCDGENLEPRIFRTWAPKAIALIGELPGTLADRSITVRLRRRARTETVERVRLDRLANLEPLRQQAARWAADHLADLRGVDPNVPEELHDRAQDNWRPLFAIADAAGSDWPAQARAAALTLSGLETDEAVGVQLLVDLQELFDERGVGRLSTQEILAVLVAMEERRWPEWRHGQPLAGAGLARLLKPFGISPAKWRLASETVRGYERVAFADAFSRYLPSSNATNATDLLDNDLPESRNATDRENVAFRKPSNSLKNIEVAPVAFEKGRAEGKKDIADEVPPYRCHLCHAALKQNARGGWSCSTCFPAVAPLAGP